MSSSEPAAAAGRFFASAAAGLALVFAVLAGAMLTVDPLGATAGNRLCPAGAKTLDSRNAVQLIAQRLRPRTIVLGTSRVRLGFGESSLAGLGPAPVANLGTTGGLPADFAMLAEDALAGGRLKKAYIGVDFNTLHQQPEAISGTPIAATRLPTLERWRRAFLSFDALYTLPATLTDCHPRQYPDGAPVLTRSGRPDIAAMPLDAGRAYVAPLLRGPDAIDPRFATRVATLRSLVVRLKSRGVEVVLFSAPYREEMVSLFDAARRADDFEVFHRRIDGLARETGVRFVDLHAGAPLHDLGLPPCPRGGIGCNYLDLTHYLPLVGEKISHALAAAPRPAQEPTPRP